MESVPIAALVQEFVAQQPQLLRWATVALPDRLPHEQKLRQWLDGGYAAQMQWFHRTIETRVDPKSWVPGLNHAWIFLCKLPRPLRSTATQKFKVSAYAQGPDYHHYFNKLLYELAQQVSTAYPEFAYRVFCDAQPVAERELAQLAGLGWRGKNSLLINPQLGSGFFIGGLFCNLDLGLTQSAQPDFCGHCTRCIDACPTQAISSAGQVDAAQCISYLTIEHPGEFDESQQSQLHGWIFGCDICQEVCPWNHKHLDANPELDFWPSGREAWDALFVPGSGLNNRIKKTPLSRAGKKGLWRNFKALDA